MKRFVKGICAALVAALALGLVSCESNVGKGLTGDLSSAKTTEYGSYAQDIVTDASVIAELEGRNLSDGERVTVGVNTYECAVAAPYRKGGVFSDGTEIVEGNKYYFAVKPISWYVLAEDEYTVVISEKILDVSMFNAHTEIDDNGNYPNNWGYSTLRSFLNEEFAEKAFGTADLAGIVKGKVVSNDTEAYYTNHSGAIKDTYDKVYSISYKESVNDAYGFSANDGDYDVLRMAKVTDYAKAKGVSYYIANAKEGDTDYEREHAFDGNGSYWMRTVGHEDNYAAIVRYTGAVGKLYEYVSNTNVGVRPMMKLGYAL